MARSRSEQMCRIRGKNTEPERILRRALWTAGMRYRLHHRTPAGRPDVVFPGPRVAVFIDGCFWHGCPLHYVRPGSNEHFWADKLAENVARDRRQTTELEGLGWRVVRVWEHEVFEEIERCVVLVQDAVSAETWSPAPDWRVVRVLVVDVDERTEQRFMEQLRSPEQQRSETGRRITAKWRHPR